MVVITRKSKPEVGGRRARRAHGPAKEGKNNNVSRAAEEAPPLNLWQNNGEDQEDLANIFTRKKKKVNLHQYMWSDMGGLNLGYHPQGRPQAQKGVGKCSPEALTPRVLKL